LPVKISAHDVAREHDQIISGFDRFIAGGRIGEEDMAEEESPIATGPCFRPSFGAHTMQYFGLLKQLKNTAKII